MTTRSAAKTLMGQEIAEQPQTLRRLIAGRDEVHAIVRQRMPPKLRGIALLGRGSSDNALVYGRYVLEIATGCPVTFVAPSIHDLYAVDVDYRGYVAIGASQSGRTPEIVNAMKRLGISGASTIAVTADTSSPLAMAAHAVIDLRTGLERAIPATKTFTAELAVMAMAAEAMGSVPWHGADWDALVEVVADVVANDDSAWRVVHRLHEVQRITTTARGVLFAVAREAALKLEEAALVSAVCHPAASFRHGPIAAAAPGSATIAVSAPGRAGEDVDGLVAALRARDVPIVTVGPSPGADLPVPPGLPEALMAVPASVRVQQLALALALHRGLDPDRPPGLEKVTAT